MGFFVKQNLKFALVWTRWTVLSLRLFCKFSFITTKQNKIGKSDAPHRTCIHCLCYVHGYPDMPKLFLANKLKIMLKLQSLSKYCAKSGFFVVCFGFMLFLMGFIWTTHSSRVITSKRRSDFFQKRK